MHFKKLNIISIFFTSLLLIILLACTDSNTKTETHSINLNIKNGTLVEEITIKANQKDTIIFNIRSDQRGIVHLHGYNIEMPEHKDDDHHHDDHEKTTETHLGYLEIWPN